jgi:teichuronic acid biosynthesis glycosyltransferase TuaG
VNAEATGLGRLGSTNPEVTFISTVRDGSRYLERMLDSLQSQTRTDWKLLIVDDGSRDGTTDILKRRSARDARIVPIFTSGIGRGRALNLALESATSEIVANIDADDLCHPLRLELQEAVLRDRPDIDVLGAEVVIIGPATKAIGDESLPFPVSSSIGSAIVDVTSRLVLENPLCHSSVMMRRSAVVAAGGYAEERRSQFDYELWVRLARHGSRLGRIQRVLVGKRFHQGQSFEASSRIGYVKSSAAVQWAAIRQAGYPARGLIALLARAAWGLVARPIRSQARRLLKPIRAADPPGGQSPATL